MKIKFIKPSQGRYRYYFKEVTYDIPEKYAKIYLMNRYAIIDEDEPKAKSFKP